MRSCIVLTLVGLALCPPAAPASDAHLVRGADIAGALSRARLERVGQVQRLRHFLESEPALRAAARIGVDAVTLSASVASLTDAELRDVGSRAERLNADPIAGTNYITAGLNELFTIAIIVVVLIVVLIVVAVNV